MGSLLVKVKAKMALHAHEKVRSVLEGEYGSVFKGRSMDFDDLRQYVPGDDVKDIDWKATARSGATLIKRYVAVRKHNIMLVVNTGRDMAATAESGEIKRDIAVMLAGVVGYIALKHGDLVALTAGSSKHTTCLTFKGNNTHLERILQHVHGSIALDSEPGDVLTQLEFIAKTMRRRMMLIVITDDGDMPAAYEQVVRRLRAQHEILWLTVGDAAGTETAEFYDIDGQALLGGLVTGNSALADEFAAARTGTIRQNAHMLERLGVMSERVTAEADVVEQLYRLLERHKRARRR